MKKGSTIAAKRSTKISQQKLTVGLDLGDSAWTWANRALRSTDSGAKFALRDPWPNGWNQ